MLFYMINKFSNNYLSQLFERRRKLVHPGEESARWKQLGILYMSNESSDESTNEICVHRPVWRSKSKLFNTNTINLMACSTLLQNLTVF